MNNIGPDPWKYNDFNALNTKFEKKALDKNHKLFYFSVLKKLLTNNRGGGLSRLFLTEKIMLNNTEILKVAELVSQEKGIDKDIVMEALEESFEIIGKSKYGMDNNIKAEIDRITGNISLSHIKDVVEKIDPVLQSNQILLDHAKKYDTDTEVGKQVHIPLPSVNFGRVTANMARQVIYSRVREAEKRRQFNDFKDRVGEVLSGIVKRIEFNNIIVDLGKAEGFLRKDELIPRENFKTGDRIRAYFFDIKEEAKGHQIFLSRTHPQFMAKLSFKKYQRYMKVKLKFYQLQETIQR